MSQDPLTTKDYTPERPLNLGLNDGIYMPQACLDVLRRLDSRTALRNYASEDNRPLLEAIARREGLAPENVFLQNGSGPILRQVVPWVIKDRVMGSPTRVVRHLVNRSGYPVLTPKFTYGKVPSKAVKLKINVQLLPCGPENGFLVDVADLERRLEKQDSFVYIVSPNNPSGNAMVTVEQMEPLIARFPESRFFMDEAYVEFLDPARARTFGPLVKKYDNLMVCRSFSFAWGLAAAHVGYLLAQPALVATMRGQLTEYIIGKLGEDLCVAALGDAAHLPYLREECAKERDYLAQGMARYPFIEIFPSVTHFFLARFKDGRTGKELSERMRAKGIRIKTISAIGEDRFDEYFRITLGVHAENEFFLSTLHEILADWKR